MKTTATDALGGAARVLAELMSRGASAGLGLLDRIYGSGSGASCGCGTDGCDCCIPAACWAPQPLCAVTSRACPGTEAAIRLRITNCGSTPRTVVVEAGGKAPAPAVKPGQVALGPLERGFVVVSFAVPADAAKGQEHEFVVWVRGCQDHFLRWTVKAASAPACTCEEVEVEDCPDLVHRWYDHFYCQRPCPRHH